MTPSPRLLVAGCAILLLFAVSLGFGQRRSTSSIGDPTQSGFAFVTDLFPPRALQANDLHSVACFDRATSTFVVDPSAGCSFPLPSAVQQINLTWTSGPRVTLTVTRANDLTQIYHSDDSPQRASQPGRLDVAITGSGSAASFTCAGPTGCRVTLR